MNFKLIAKTIGRILLMEAALMLLPVLISLFYEEHLQNTIAFLVSIAILLFSGLIMSGLKTESTSFNIKDGFVLVSFTWILMSVYGALPFYISGEIPDFIDALFETASGFTTTGASVVENVELLSPSILFWRSFTHFIGGMGILVFALAVLPKAKGAVNIMKAEVPGPAFGKLVSKLDITAQILYKIYIAMTAALIIILKLAGMSFFDAMIHAFGTAGTGGFSNKVLSIGYYNSPLIEWIIAIAMMVFGINFNLFYLALMGRIKDVFKSLELKVYILMWLMSSAMIAIRLGFLSGGVGSRLIRDVFFTTSSLMTSTGYATADYTGWDMFSQLVLLILMLVGACAGSTAGGIKVSRIITLFKSGINSLRNAINPRRVSVVSDEGKLMSGNAQRDVMTYLFLYTVVFTVSLGVILLNSHDFFTGVSAVAATLNNIGPGMAAVGPRSGFYIFSPFTKLFLTFIMIAGRLEIIPMLVLFVPGTWRKK